MQKWIQRLVEIHNADLILVMDGSSSQSSRQTLYQKCQERTNPDRKNSKPRLPTSRRNRSPNRLFRKSALPFMLGKPPLRFI